MTARTCARVRAGEPAIKRTIAIRRRKTASDALEGITGRRERGRPQQSRRARRQLR